jgi:hypothetical protein
MGKTIELAISEISLPVSDWGLSKNAKFSHIHLKIGNDPKLQSPIYGIVPLIPLKRPPRSKSGPQGISQGSIGNYFQSTT